MLIDESENNFQALVKKTSQYDDTKICSYL